VVVAVVNGARLATPSVLSVSAGSASAGREVCSPEIFVPSISPGLIWSKAPPDALLVLYESGAVPKS
jgi:hypothetical protein